MGNPSAQDLQRLTNATNNLTRAINTIGDSMRAMNTNLVALHELAKEMNEKDE